MDFKSRSTYRSCNVEHIESQNFADLEKCVSEMEQEAGKYLFDADGFSYEQPDQEPFLIDHRYSMALVASSGNQIKLFDCVPQTFKEAMNSLFSAEWKPAICEELELLVDHHRLVYGYFC